jgi:hypothetical protein
VAVGAGIRVSVGTLVRVGQGVEVAIGVGCWFGVHAASKKNSNMMKVDLFMAWIILGLGENGQGKFVSNSRLFWLHGKTNI